jgi:hypothetical protein
VIFAMVIVVVVVASTHALVVLTVSHDLPVANPFVVAADAPSPYRWPCSSSRRATQQPAHPRLFKQELK